MKRLPLPRSWSSSRQLCRGGSVELHRDMEKRSAWSLACSVLLGVLCTVGFFYQANSVMQTYLDHPYQSVMTADKRQGLVFPSVTICTGSWWVFSKVTLRPRLVHVVIVELWSYPEPTPETYRRERRTLTMHQRDFAVQSFGFFKIFFI